MICAAVAAALAAGCESNATQESQPTSSASSSPPPASPTDEGTPAKPPIRLAAWTVLNRWPMDRRLTGEFNGPYRAVVDEHDTWADESQTARFLDAQGRRVLRRESGGEGWFTQDVWLTEHYAVVEDLNLDARDIRLFVYDLRTGKQVPAPSPPISQPEMDASAGRVAYLSGRATTKICLQLLELDTGTTTQLACGRRGDVLGDVAMDAAGDVTYSSVRKPDTPKRCKTVLAVRPGDRPLRPQSVPARQRCLAWSGVVLPGGVAWDEADPYSEDLAFGQGYVEQDGEITELGLLDTDTLVACGDRFFWEAQDERGSRVDSIKPGGQPVTIWGPKENGVPTGLKCADGRWLQARFDDVSSDNLPMEFQVLDTSQGLDR